MSGKKAFIDFDKTDPMSGKKGKKSYVTIC
jgi:hypothetical protein